VVFVEKAEKKVVPMDFALENVSLIMKVQEDQVGIVIECDTSASGLCKIV
jgi:hypothetical protein